MHFDCVNGFLNSIKEIIWQTEAIYCCPLRLYIKSDHLIMIIYLLPLFLQILPEELVAYWYSHVFYVLCCSCVYGTF